MSVHPFTSSSYVPSLQMSVAPGTPSWLPTTIWVFDPSSVNQSATLPKSIAAWSPCWDGVPQPSNADHRTPPYNHRYQSLSILLCFSYDTRSLLSLITYFSCQVLTHSILRFGNGCLSPIQNSFYFFFIHTGCFRVDERYLRAPFPDEWQLW